MELKSLEHIFKNAMNRQPLPFIRRVQVVWHLALLIALIGIVAISIFSWILYSNIQSDKAFQSNINPSEIKGLIKQTRLESVLKEFEIKAENFKNLNFVKPVIKDPSL